MNGGKPITYGDTLCVPWFVVAICEINSGDSAVSKETAEHNACISISS